MSTEGKEEIISTVRQTADYHPTVWGDYFINSKMPTPHNLKLETVESVKERITELVKEVKGRLVKMKEDSDSADRSSSLKLLELIDSLERLGISYHFQEDIEEALRAIYNTSNSSINDDDKEDDGSKLHAVALRFRLLRQHAYFVPCSVFVKFTKGNKFDESLIGRDAKGLLSLYEAGYLRVPGESLLDDAIDFARNKLSYLVVMDDQHQGLNGHDQRPLPSVLKKQILLALQTPLRKKMRRLETRHYLSIYEESILMPEDEEEVNADGGGAAVLELAKLDFHLLQSLHREEVKKISEWWRSLGLAKDFSFARDRVVECYFWILCVYFEPHFSRARVMMTKVIALLSLTDDIYDVYATLDELERFTQVIQRWDVKAVDRLEEYLTAQFEQGLDRATKDFKVELAADVHDNSYRVDYLIEQIKGSSRAWLEEARWREQGLVPNLSDYLRVTTISTCYPTLTCASFVGLHASDLPNGKEAFEWISTHPKILMDVSRLCRIMDDIVSHGLEQKRKHVASAVQCYMKEHESTKEDAIDKLTDMVEYSWKELNKEWLARPAPLVLTTRILNLARIMDTLYKKIDAYTHSDTILKDYITLLLVEPVSF